MQPTQQGALLAFEGSSLRNDIDGLDQFVIFPRVL